MLRATLIAVLTASTGLLAATQDETGGRDRAAAADVPSAAAEGGPRRWQVEIDGTLDLKGAPSADSRTVRTVGDGTVLSNLGCETIDGRVWCRVETLRGKIRGHAPADRLRPARGPDGTVPVGVDDSPRRARQGDFDARGLIPCAQERGQPMVECAVGVARGDGGDATVVASFPNGFERTLYFRHGEFVAANATMSGSGSDIDWRKAGDRHLIRVDDQRYELSDDILLGR